MATKSPKVGDPVHVNEPKCSGIYLLTKIDAEKKLADAQSTLDPSGRLRDVPWDLISPIEEKV
jgi:hypothetical protein